MIANIPEWMLEQGSKAKKCCVKYFPNQQQPPPFASSGSTVASNTAPIPAWRLKTDEEYIVSLSQAEVRKKGGRDKLSQPPKNRYFKRKRLSDIILLHATTRATTRDDTRRWTLGRVYPLFVRCLGSGSVEVLDSLSSGAASVHHGRFDALAATTARLGIESQGGRPSEFASANLLCTAVGSNDLSEETSECAEDTGTKKLVAAAQPIFEQVSSGAFGTTQ